MPSTRCGQDTLPGTFQPQQVSEGNKDLSTPLPSEFSVSGTLKTLGGQNCPTLGQPHPVTSDPRSWGDGSGPWGQDKHHCFVSGVDTLQLMGSYPGHNERKRRPRVVHTGRLLGQGAVLPLPPASPGARGGSTTPWPPSHGSGPRVRRALNLACLGEHRPGHDPLLLPLPARGLTPATHCHHRPDMFQRS